MAGLLIGNASWGVHSNKESGEGFADLMVEPEEPNTGMVIELKRVDRPTELEGACRQALEQIHHRDYGQYLRSEGYKNIWAYGIAFYKKRCRVLAEKLD